MHGICQAVVLIVRLGKKEVFFFRAHNSTLLVIRLFNSSQKAENA